jgi:hypothetical protein
MKWWGLQLDDDDLSSNASLDWRTCCWWKVLMNHSSYFLILLWTIIWYAYISTVSLTVQANSSDLDNILLLGGTTTTTTSSSRRWDTIHNDLDIDINVDDDPSSSVLSKLCGTYRAYPYVGIRCHYETSPLMGLMWYKPSFLSSSSSSSSSSSQHCQSSVSLQSLLRHESTHDDQLDRFGWNEHDGKSYGRQEISDSNNQVNLTIQWIYLGVDSEDDDEDENTDDYEITITTTRTKFQIPFDETRQQQRSLRWALRVRGDVYHTPDQEDGVDVRQDHIRDLSLVWYVATPDNLTSTYHPSDRSIRGDEYTVWMDISRNASHPIYIDDRTNSTNEYNTSYFAAFQVPTSQHYNPKPTLLQELRNPTSSLPPHLFDPTNLYRAATAKTGNQVLQQVFFTLPFEVDIHFLHHQQHHRSDDVLSTHESKRGAVDDDDEETELVVKEGTVTSMRSKDDEWDRVTTALDNARNDFVRVFSKTFIKKPQSQQQRQDPATRSSTERRTAATNIGSSNLSSFSSSSSWSGGQIRTGHYALGNMLSSITYMHGDRLVYEIETDRIVSQPSHSGWTVVPDRPDHAQGK